jgi:hypothetical protein
VIAMGIVIGVYNRRQGINLQRRIEELDRSDPGATR